MSLSRYQVDRDNPESLLLQKESIDEDFTIGYTPSPLIIRPSFGDVQRYSRARRPVDQINLADSAAWRFVIRVARRNQELRRR